MTNKGKFIAGIIIFLTLVICIQTKPRRNINNEYNLAICRYGNKTVKFDIVDSKVNKNIFDVITKDGKKMKLSVNNCYLSTK